MKIIKRIKYLFILSCLAILFSVACGSESSDTTSTPTPAPTPAPTTTNLSTTIDSYGFTLNLVGDIEIQTSGVTTPTASNDEGVVFFEYDGASSIMLWLKDSDTEIKNFLADSYTSLAGSQSDVTFTPINEGDTKVDENDSKFVAFVTESGETQAGGIIGTWRCGNDKLFSLTSTGLDGAVIQIRFKRILDGFSCTK